MRTTHNSGSSKESGCQPWTTKPVAKARAVNRGVGSRIGDLRVVRTSRCQDKDSEELKLPIETSGRQPKACGPMLILCQRRPQRGRSNGRDGRPRVLEGGCKQDNGARRRIAKMITHSTFEPHCNTVHSEHHKLPRLAGQVVQAGIIDEKYDDCYAFTARRTSKKTIGISSHGGKVMGIDLNHAELKQMKNNDEENTMSAADRSKSRRTREPLSSELPDTVWRRWRPRKTEIGRGKAKTFELRKRGLAIGVKPGLYGKAMSLRTMPPILCRVNSYFAVLRGLSTQFLGSEISEAIGTSAREKVKSEVSYRRGPAQRCRRSEDKWGICTAERAS
ncbi:hypothetical protein FB451DRAFT_1193231 [Mycena latifolia]|nr:hypothetical protein FB451DRAFT_1193231 [Mycena latifolia]